MFYCDCGIPVAEEQIGYHNAGQGQVEKKNLICPKCAGLGCKTHGRDVCNFKCEFCCNVATFSCHAGITQYCEECHNEQEKNEG